MQYRALPLEGFRLFMADTIDAALDLPTLLDYAAKHPFAALELRGIPYDTTRHFDPVTQEGEEVGGPAVLVSLAALKQVGEPDPTLPGWAQMKELSARLRAAGLSMGYCPFVSAPSLPVEDTLAGYLEQLEGAYLLACKYGTAAERAAARSALLDALKNPKHYPGVRKRLAAALPAVLAKGALVKRSSACALAEVTALRENRGLCACTPFTQQPLVSVVIRTCRRKEVLRRTLQCLQYQTYRNFEVVVVEDGQDTARQMLENDFPGLNFRYICNGVNVGRGRAGNIGIEHARGEYVCFLDDDDFYYPDFIEAHLARFMAHPDTDLVLSSIMAFEVDVASRDPYVFTVHKRYPVIFDHLNLMDMCIKCRIPMTGAMFRRSLYEQVGGMREDIDGDEDWAMWLRYWKIARRIDATVPDIPRAVSMFGYPADPAAAQKRLDAYEVYDELMLADPDLCFACTPEMIAGWQATVKADIAHLRQHGLLQDFLRDAAKHPAAPLPTDGSKTCTLTAQQINRYYWYLAAQYAKE